MAEKKKIHNGHRGRMLSQYRKGGSAGMADHNLLEMLLFFSLPRVNTNEIAHELIERCGSLENVFMADPDVLKSVDGIGQKSADLIRLCADIGKRIDMNRHNEHLDCHDDEALRAYLSDRMGSYREECLIALLLDNSGKLIKDCLIEIGSVSAVDVNLPRIASEAMTHKAASIILAHNHPGADVAPSDEDIASTRYVMRVLKPLDLSLTEHFVVSGDKTFGIVDYLRKEERRMLDEANRMTSVWDAPSKRPEPVKKKNADKGTKKRD